VVPTSILSPDADMVVERTTLGASGLGDWAGGDSASKAGGKETVLATLSEDSIAGRGVDDVT